MSEINYVLIGKRIRETRTQMKLSQAALAEMSGLSPRYISHIETAHKKASLSSLVNIANAIGISVDEILYGNQTSYKTDYQLDIILLIENCTPSEKRYLYLLISSVINILRDNGWQIEDELASSIKEHKCI